MATIKAGTYTLKEVVDLSTSVSTDFSANITIGDVTISATAELPFREVYVSSTGIHTIQTYTFSNFYFYQNGSWVNDIYRTWVFSVDTTVNDNFAAWFNANIYVPEAKFIRLIREDEIPSGSVEYMTIKVSYSWEVDYGTGSAVVMDNGEGGGLSATLLNDYNVKTLTLYLPYTGKFNMVFTPDESAIDHQLIYYTFDNTEPSYNNNAGKVTDEPLSLSNIEKGAVLWVSISLGD